MCAQKSHKAVKLYGKHIDITTPRWYNNMWDVIFNISVYQNAHRMCFEARWRSERVLRCADADGKRALRLAAANMLNGAETCGDWCLMLFFILYFSPFHYLRGIKLYVSQPLTSLYTVVFSIASFIFAHLFYKQNDATIKAASNHSHFLSANAYAKLRFHCATPPASSTKQRSWHAPWYHRFTELPRLLSLRQSWPKTHVF